MENDEAQTPAFDRRDVLKALSGAALVANKFTGAFAATQPQEETNKYTKPFFFQPQNSLLWDTWVYFHKNIFYLYYLRPPGVGLATSSDGIHWRDYGVVVEKALEVARGVGSGAVWPALSDGPEGKFVMNFSERRGGTFPDGVETIFFAESRDLINWTRLGPQYEFRQDARWYEPKGRWENMWVIPRPGGGYYGYWAATPKDKIGLGFGESSDGITWTALEPPVLEDLGVQLPISPSPEVSAVYVRKGKYYALIGLDDLEPTLNSDLTDFRPGHTTFMADSPAGPFVPAPKNRRLLVGNASYFLRFVDTSDGVLVNFHSWVEKKGARLNIHPGTVCFTPLKRAVWDEEGTLRLKWWESNEKAKGMRVRLKSRLLDTAFDPDEVLILEGTVALRSSPTGLFLEGAGDKGTGFLVHKNGLVKYGNINRNGAGFQQRGYVDRELAFEGQVRFRLIRNGRITEFYINDYLMQCYALPEQGSGHIGLVGPAQDFHGIKAWYCA